VLVEGFDPFEYDAESVVVVLEVVAVNEFDFDREIEGYGASVVVSVPSHQLTH
jgi:hypothetical protein